jgi:hypothetical protein
MALVAKGMANKEINTVKLAVFGIHDQESHPPDHVSFSSG